MTGDGPTTKTVRAAIEVVAALHDSAIADVEKLAPLAVGPLRRKLGQSRPVLEDALAEVVVLELNADTIAALLSDSESKDGED